MAPEPPEPPEPPIRGRKVRCEAVAKTFHGPGGPVPALGPVDVTFEAGRTTALVGPSGCGKSTLLRIVAGLEEASAGTVRIGDEGPRDLARRAGLAMAFQDASLLPWRTVRGNVALGLTLARRAADPARVDRLIALVGLAGFEDRRPAELSGGMRQRAAIARCLVARPELLLLDEPFGAVDELTRRRLGRELPALWAGTTALLVTHSVSEAVTLAHRILVLSPRPARIVARIAPAHPAPDAPLQEGSAAFREAVAEVSDALMSSAPDRPLAAQ
jgi:NitT/TauT family transport system ATP-binding protein